MGILDYVSMAVINSEVWKNAPELKDLIKPSIRIETSSRD
jgi:hypothetical protein